MTDHLERRVMANVGAIYVARQLRGTLAIKLYVLAAGGLALWRLVWVHRVVENWARVGVGGTWDFLTYAMLHTTLPVQLAVAACAATGLWILLDATRSLLVPRQRLYYRL